MTGVIAIMVGVGSLAEAGLLAYRQGDWLAVTYFAVTGIGCILGGLLYTGG